MHVGKLDGLPRDQFDLMTLVNHVNIPELLLDIQLNRVEIFVGAPPLRFFFFVVVFRVLIFYFVPLSDIAFVDVYIFRLVRHVLFNIPLSCEIWNCLQLEEICRIMIDVDMTHYLDRVGVGIGGCLVHCSDRGVHVIIEHFCSDITRFAMISLSRVSPHGEIVIITFYRNWFPAFYMFIPCLLPLIAIIDEHLFSRLDVSQSNKLQHKPGCPLFFQIRDGLSQPIIVMYPRSVGSPAKFRIVLGRVMIDVRHIG
mmetsp:Transcript_24857/g.44722  ORF Transcript_24857/g.44722 Transcript_24857/m.44722 type:complete len:254 (-) Transcript_24857:1022-1783(-)